MASQIYITDEVRANLETVADLDKRKIVDELDYLVSERLRQIELQQSQPENVVQGSIPLGSDN